MNPGYKAIEYIGTKTTKNFEGYVWNGNGDVISVDTATAAKCLTHPDVFAEEGSGSPTAANFSYAAGGANVAEVTVTLDDGEGNVLDNGVANFGIWLSDDAEGAGLTATSASGTVQAKAASGTDLEIVTAKKHLRVQSLKDAGTYVLEITDTAKTGFYPAVNLAGATFVGPALVTGDYG